ncbi:hypothetical protein PGT21_003167 [Puccinia graminis f. sp. tritici]|uniref:Uncharacterized protein n=1 Tax=Puccinia graminis f. sp. tritici TaxID=56615 RepID=A0A5B0ND49_PUCGR|nr:hypothetical protein PGTUg99_017468 [Puccinia graminis f. sp. tritici]KAA1088991.1 hypothetical protein PGT21_003167 [Puccinia graminis f. sp. tritici]
MDRIRDHNASDAADQKVRVVTSPMKYTSQVIVSSLPNSWRELTESLKFLTTYVITDGIELGPQLITQMGWMRYDVQFDE